MHRLFALLLCAASFSAHAEAPPKPRWRYRLAAPLKAQPAVSESGRIALVVGASLEVLDEKGRRIARVPGLKPSQPMWQGDVLWYRDVKGWRRWPAGTDDLVCDIDARLGAVDAQGPVFAAPGAIVRCAAPIEIIAQRRPDPSSVMPFFGGWLATGEWLVESFGPKGLRASRPVSELGFPAGLGGAGEAIVVRQGGELRGVDALLQPLWAGPVGLDGPPVTGSSGASLLAAGRSVVLASPPFESWRLAVPGGVRATAMLASGDVALLERTGHLALIREGRPVWATTLAGADNFLGLTPAGALLVQNRGALEALPVGTPDRSGALPVWSGTTRAWTSGSPESEACPPPVPPKRRGGRLVVSGFQRREAGRCRGPQLSASARSRPPQPVLDASCGEGCRVTVTPERLFWSDAAGRIESWREGPGRRIERASGEPLVGIGVDGDRWFAVPATLVPSRVVGPQVMWRKRVVGLSEDGRLWWSPEGRTLASRALPASSAEGWNLLAWEGTLCASIPGAGGCTVDDAFGPLLHLVPRAAWFGEQVRACDGGEALCVGLGDAPKPIWRGRGRIVGMLPTGDGSLVVLAGAELVWLWPSGDVRWRLSLAPTGCADDRSALLARVGNGKVAAHSCGRLVVLPLE